jgi:hypothetical protein
VYNFPIKAQFQVLHVDAYSASVLSSFEGPTSYLIGCCGMCSFGILEPVTGATASTFASAIMKMQLRFGLCHTVVLDKDSKFFSIYRESLDHLKINCNVLSGDNHNPMLVKLLCRYYNKGLSITTNEYNSVHMALEALLLLLYTWNSCPIPGRDISRSLVAIGSKLAFFIHFSTGMHQEMMSSPSTNKSYSHDLSECLAACRKIATLLVSKHHTWHRELINSRRCNPRVYNPNDIVFACWAAWSDASRGCIGKLKFSFTGPWWVIGSADGGSYNIELFHHPTWHMMKTLLTSHLILQNLSLLNLSMAPIPSIANSTRPLTLILLIKQVSLAFFLHKYLKCLQSLSPLAITLIFGGQHFKNSMMT